LRREKSWLPHERPLGKKPVRPTLSVNYEVGGKTSGSGNAEELPPAPVLRPPEELSWVGNG